MAEELCFPQIATFLPILNNNKLFGTLTAYGAEPFVDKYVVC